MIHRSKVVGLGGVSGGLAIKGSCFFINGLKKNNLLSAENGGLSRYILCYPLSSGFSGCNVPLVDLDNVGPATLTSYVASDWTTAGLLGNSSTKRTDTRWNPFTRLVSGSGHLFRWNNVNGNAVPSSLGAQDASARGFYLGAESSSTNWWASIGGNGGSEEINITHTETTAFYIVTRQNSGTTFLRRTTTQLGATTTALQNVFPNWSLFIHAKNTDSGAINFNNDRTWIMGAGRGLSNQQCDMLADLTNQLKLIIKA